MAHGHRTHPTRCRFTNRRRGRALGRGARTARRGIHLYRLCTLGRRQATLHQIPRRSKNNLDRATVDGYPSHFDGYPSFSRESRDILSPQNDPYLPATRDGLRHYRVLSRVRPIQKVAVLPLNGPETVQTAVTCGGRDRDSDASPPIFRPKNRGDCPICSDSWPFPESPRPH